MACVCVCVNLSQKGPTAVEYIENEERLQKYLGQRRTFRTFHIDFSIWQNVEKGAKHRAACRFRTFR